MKKAIIFASCALLSTPIIAKSFVEHITQVKKHKIVQSSKHVDFSGHWVGLCGVKDGGQKVILDLKQSDNKLSFLMQHDNFKLKQDYVFNMVKLESNGSPKNLENVMSYAVWETENTVSLEFHSNSFHTEGRTEDTYSYRMMIWSRFNITLEGDKLSVYDLDDNDEESSCVFHKEG